MENPSPLRRRSSAATAVTIPTLHSSDFELYSLSNLPPPPSSSSSAYTSIKDLLPTVAVNSPTAAGAAYEISIRNRLVKQAAWAYLQPMSASSGSSGHHFLRGFWLKLAALRHPIKACFRFVQLNLFPSISQFFRSVLA
ncbi:hypothetical protein LINPERPRIM_LOCUS26822 [Linum perenne]